MRAIVRHPVPVRWRPARARLDRHAFLSIRTPIEIPEVERRELGEARAKVAGAELDCLVHAGLCYRTAVQRDFIDLGGRGQPATHRELTTLLDYHRDAPGEAFRPGTPLRASGPHAAVTFGMGNETLPRSVLSRGAEPPVEAARAAVADYVARTFLLCDERVLVRIPTPVATPHANGDLCPVENPHVIGANAYGLGFEPDRIGAMVDYLKVVGYRGYSLKAAEMPAHHAARTEFPVAGRDDDLGRWANDVPSMVEFIVERARDLAAKCNYDVSAADTHVRGLLPLADLGLVGAVPRASWGAAAEGIGNALDAIRTALPKEHPQPPLNWLKAYSDVVARPALCAAPSTLAEDAEDLAALAPSR